MSIPAFEGSLQRRSVSRSPRRVYDVLAASKTLPLVRQVVREIPPTVARLAHLELQLRRVKSNPEEARRKGRRRFELQELRDQCRRRLEELRSELQHLGIDLIDPVRGVVGFPTIVNGSLAYLRFEDGDEGLARWMYRDDDRPRPIPQAWYADATLDAANGHAS